MPEQSDLVISETLVQSGDAALFVRAAGGYAGGPVLVLLHGGPGLSHEYMLPLLEQLASPALRVVTYDQREVGRSSGRAASSHPLEEWAADLEAVRRSQRTEQIHLLAHSGGGLPAIAYATRFAQHTASIVFVDSIAPSAAGLGAALGRFHSRIAELQRSGAISSALPATTPEDATDWLLEVMPVYFANSQHVGARNLNGARFRADVYDRLQQGLGSYDLRPDVARLSMPILNYIAEIPFGIEMAGELADALPRPNMRWFALPNTGHLPWVESPEPFLRAVVAFLEPLFVQQAR